MVNIFLRRNENDKTRDFSAVIRGVLALVILFVTLAVDVIITDKYHKSGLPHVPGTVFIGGFAIFIIILIGIGVIFTALDKDSDEFKKNKSLFVFFFGLGMSLIAIAIYSGISLYSLYSKHIVEIASLLANYLSLIFANCLSLIIIGLLLQLHKEV